MFPQAYFGGKYWSEAYFPRTSSTGTTPWFTQLTDLSAVQELDIPVGARSVLIQADTQNVRYRMDGGSPAAGVGLLMRTTDLPMSFSGAIQLLRFIEATSGAKLNVQFR